MLKWHREAGGKYLKVLDSLWEILKGFWEVAGKC
jgi:hypothetical protein